MSRPDRTWLWSTVWRISVFAAALACAAQALASTIQLKDGRKLQGRIGNVAGMADSPIAKKADDTQPVVFVDDDLRRVFIPKFQIRGIEEAGAETKEKIAISQRVAKDVGGKKINRVGPIVKVTPFDEYGHRTFSMMIANNKQLDIVQGITQITPVYTKVEGLVTKTPFIWDMRIATSSIPVDVLRKVLARNINEDNLEHRLKLVRLLLQQERFKDAQVELEAVIAHFPKKKELAPQVQALRQLHARSIVKEIQIRRKAGQHVLAYKLLEKFPTEDVAGETLQQVREMLDEYRDLISKRERLLNELKDYIATIQNENTRKRCDALLEEMTQELNVNTLDRMADYLRLSSDESLGPEQKLALAFSGWLLGSNRADVNLAVALSLAEVRDVVIRYFNESNTLERNALFDRLGALEGASPALVADLIAHMKPPLPAPESSVGKPGLYELEIPGIDKEPDVTYYVQLPPQYDPHVRYPTVLTLNGAATTPEQQIDWWAGAEDANGNRLGQATRHGYIVVAVAWQKEAQRDYEFSAREHAAVLGSLRDACRRFSIDTDRVYLSGHSMGGNAAWDLGLAHPDLWAGVIPIVAHAEKYCARYSENAALVPFYFVAGELDGRNTVENAPYLDVYMKRRYDVTVTEYQGRGHEDFYEDILNIFDWMGRKQRNFFPKTFTVATMRTWDNYFWWVEARDFPSKAMIEPSDWPPPRGVRPVEIACKVLASNGLSINSGDIKATVWLSPEMVDFSRPITVTLNNSAINKGNRRIAPDLSVLLEDVRTRGDRQHPFWAKVE